MGFTIPESQYVGLVTDMGRFGVHVVNQVGNVLREKARRTWEIAFDRETRTVTILDSEELSSSLLKKVLEQFQGHSWVPRPLVSKMKHEDKKFCLVCSSSHTAQGYSELKRRRDDGASDDDGSDCETQEKKLMRVITQQIAFLPITTGSPNI